MTISIVVTISEGILVIQGGRPCRAYASRVSGSLGILFALQHSCSQFPWSSFTFSLWEQYSEFLELVWA